MQYTKQSLIFKVAKSKRTKQIDCYSHCQREREREREREIERETLGIVFNQTKVTQLQIS